MNRQSVIFLAVTLVVALLVCAVGFRYAAMPPEAVARAQTPVTPERLPELDLGSFGRVSGIDLVAYWMEHPPAGQGSEAAPASVKRFGGC